MPEYYVCDWLLWKCVILLCRQCDKEEDKLWQETNFSLYKSLWANKLVLDLPHICYKFENCFS